jgi:hypothetical protein
VPPAAGETGLVTPNMNAKAADQLMSSAPIFCVTTHLQSRKSHETNQERSFSFCIIRPRARARTHPGARDLARKP